MAFNCCSKIEVQLVKDSLTKHFCCNLEHPYKNYRLVKVKAQRFLNFVVTQLLQVSGCTRSNVSLVFKNLRTIAADEKIVFLIEDLSQQSWLWAECDLLGSAIRQIFTYHLDHKIVCIMQPNHDCVRHVSEIRAIFSNGFKSYVFDVKHNCSSLRWHVNVLPENPIILLKALAVVQWILHCRSVLRAGSVDACGHSSSDQLISYKGPINGLCLTFESLKNDCLSPTYFAALLCEDLLANRVHDHDVLLYRQIFLDFMHGKIDFHAESSFDSLFAAVPSCRSLVYFISETASAYLEENVLRPVFFGLCSKQDDVPFFNESSAHIPKCMKEQRGKCFELKTKLQNAVNDVGHMLPDPISEQKWMAICTSIPVRLYPDLHPFLKMDGLILIASLNATIDRIMESVANIQTYLNNDTDLTYDISSDVGHLNFGIVPLSWDQQASSIHVQCIHYLSMLQIQKKIFDFVCMQLEHLIEMSDETDQRLTILSAGVAVRSFSALVVPNFGTLLASSNQDMMVLLGKTVRLSSLQQWMISNACDSELLFWTPNHRFGNQLRKEVLSPSALHFDSIKEFVRETLKSGIDRKSTNEGANCSVFYTDFLISANS